MNIADLFKMNFESECHRSYRVGGARHMVTETCGIVWPITFENRMERFEIDCETLQMNGSWQAIRENICL